MPWRGVHGSSSFACASDANRAEHEADALVVLSLKGGREDAGAASLRGGARPSLASAAIARMWLQSRAGATLAVVAFLACDTGGPAAPTTPPVAAPTFSLSGEVHSNRFGGPLAGARLQASGRRTTTGEDGRYAVDGLSGVVVVTVAYTGHVPANATVAMDQDQTRTSRWNRARRRSKEPRSSSRG